MTPQGSLSAIQADLAKLGKARRIDRFQAYLRGQRFRDLFALLPPGRIEACVRRIERTRKACKLPAAPKPIGRSQLSWTPPLKAKLARAYVKFGLRAHVPVAAEMGLSVGQVRLAKRRFIDSQAAAPLPIAA